MISPRRSSQMFSTGDLLLSAISLQIALADHLAGNPMQSSLSYLVRRVLHLCSCIGGFQRQRRRPGDAVAHQRWPLWRRLCSIDNMKRGEALLQDILKGIETYGLISSSAAHRPPREGWLRVLTLHNSVCMAWNCMRKLTWGPLGLQLAGNIAIFFGGVQP